MVEHTHEKTNYLTLAIVAIIAIVLIVFITLNDFQQGIVQPNNIGLDNVGGATSTVLSEQNAQLCKLLVTKTAADDDTALSTILAPGESSYYAGFTFAIDEINSNGCVVNVNGNSEYIAVGQIQQVGPLYVTVREVLQ